MNEVFDDRIRSGRRLAWIIAAAGIAVCLASLFSARPRMFQAYWMAWIFWSGLSFGSLVIVMLPKVSGGAWGEAVRGPAEAGAMTLPLSALLFIPALFGLGDIFSWAKSAAFAAHEWPHKQAYLTPAWFAIRGLGYLLILSGLTVALGLWRRYSHLPAWLHGRSEKVGAISAGGLVLYFALMLFASTDWIVSLEPQWYSTMFVVIFTADHFLGALALTVFVATLLSTSEGKLATKQWHDLGNLLLAFVIFWAYITFSQFLIIWSGNLPREISWYLHRSSGGWSRVTVAVVAIQFVVPFVLLLSRATKRHRRVLGVIALIVWLANALHNWWLIAPTFQPGGPQLPWLEVAAFVGVGGLWIGLFLGFLRSPAQEVPHA